MKDVSTAESHPAEDFAEFSSDCVKNDDIVLQIRNLEKTYRTGTQALRGVSLDIARNEVVAIIGPSGCGKSTLLRTINGLTPITAGKINFENRNLADKSTNWQHVREKIGMVFQNYELFPHLSVLKNLLLAPKVVEGKKDLPTKNEALDLLARVGLAEKANSLPSQLSGGQKQRVAIVRALMMHPEVLLLDEITASLDPEMVREVLDVILSLAHEGMTMLIVTHEMSFARAIADRIVFMDAGKIVEISDPEKFFNSPETQRAQKFLNTFRFDTDKNRANTILDNYCRKSARYFP